MKIYVATGNPHKLEEIQTILQTSHLDQNLDLHTISGHEIPEPPEPYDTFLENAKHKAQYYAEQLDAVTLSEDSGLCIQVLDNFPGVKTKDFAMESGSLEQAFARLSTMLLGKNDLSAFFICAAVIYIPQQKLFLTYEGKCHGKIMLPATGKKGFGFDPIFVPEGYDQTLAELGEIVKNKIGHRAIAIRGVMDKLISARSTQY